MRIILMLFIILFPLCSIAADSETEAIKFLEIFDGLCLQNNEKFDNIEKVIYNIPNKVLLSPDELAAGHPLLAGRGKGYGVKIDGQFFVVGWIENISCGVTLDKVSIKTLKKLIKSNYHIETIDVTSEGMQVSETYMFKKDSDYKGGIIALIYSKIKMNSKGAALNYLPEREVRKVLRKRSNDK